MPNILLPSLHPDSRSAERQGPAFHVLDAAVGIIRDEERPVQIEVVHQRTDVCRGGRADRAVDHAAEHELEAKGAQLVP